MGDRNEIRETFFLECEELLESLDDGLQQINQALQSGETDPETVNAIFRAVHSIKGGAAAFGLDQLVEFAHRFETALDKFRSGALSADTRILEIFFRANDRLVDLVAAARAGLDADMSGGATILGELDTLIGTEPQEEEEVEFVPMALDLDLGALAEDDDPVHFQIEFTPDAALYANGNDPSHLLRLLQELGDIEVRVTPEDLPPFDIYDPERSYLSWSVRLTTTEPAHVVHEVFEFVEGTCSLAIDAETAAGPSGASGALPPGADAARPGDAAPEENHETTSLGTASALAPSAVDQGAGAPPARATVRVDLERVDRLINVVGELVINQAMLAQCAENAGIAQSDDFAAGLDEFKQLSREIQESVMAIRAQPVKSLFQRMARIVREASAETGKSVRFVTEGEATEVDKTVIERLADPLTHLVRNAVDHGLETPAGRKSAGKSDTGTVTLSAAHRSGRVVIEISDDGAGIDRDRVHQIAIDRGLIPAGTELSTGEIDNLLFMAGFSTADQVSNLSGRGVGMDVVKSAIHALGGRVVINSTPGRGTSFSISLPLTLAVLEGMVVDVAGQMMVVPVTATVETLRPPLTSIHCVGTGDQVVAIRGSFIPIIDLGAFFGHRDQEGYTPERILLLVETEQGQTCALVVDAIHDQRQVVIKGLEDNYGRIPGVAAATILGDGRIALIIDPDTFFKTVAQPQPERLRAATG